MAVLAIDTSAAVAVALLDDLGTLLASRRVVEQRRHAELLAPMVEEVLAEAGLAPQDLGAVVVGTGPAPFTGLRVGLVTGRTLAFALGVPLHGVASLDAVASEAADRLDLPPGSSVLVVTDARRREVYHARYAVGETGAFGATAVTTTSGPDVGAALDVVAAGHAVEAVVVGQGTALYPDAFRDDQVPDDAPTLPDPAVLARLALARAATGEVLPSEPLYLRRPDAQVPAGAKRASG
ncbi:tRNA (adenosine(37)-N6)-threonylcarbamoyltransferase complex dimerization subunit type 1 TsaB [Sanguibacter suaedae]|uniref:tRNA (Adenosine(37)-N6)-threonylcarbamoyltransferase complex dimerization subunit type 1 TsaB n=1 Tax=Sanguibacter suaedae TaxID=2795737 RepID=A0A934M900_9MICO|nr:tRNA (adenosine(37)-N6)-threonylcarbamoyltransferase complex dimerization subunit type 1 TsaB [Sanguibacter suaedae]MBI9114085.1 tRNA (adenosine(37)-N6)-threonylcarbamoyltransferase complex dimerization subunit type 1 TsaB [Sanguibacter suaedae]